MEHNDFHFYTSENDGYRGGFESGISPLQTNRPVAHKRGAGRVIALLLACLLVGGGGGIGGAALYAQFKNSGPSTNVYENLRPQVQTVVNTNPGQPMTPEQLYAANLASCVGVTVSTTTMNYFGQASTSAASGSGFVLTQDGYIVTNYHVIEQAALNASVTIEVTLSDGEKYPAQLVGGEEANDTAVLKIEAGGLTPVVLGDSDSLVVGQEVYAIGNPLGELTFSFTNGMVTALDRLISTDENTTLNMLQTNCAINPGNSGGPLFDIYGNVIGIITAKFVQSQSGVSAEGLGFAIPINDVKTIMTDLIEHGYVTGKPYMGVQISNVPAEAQRYGVVAGAAVDYVADGSCAQRAGLQVGDIITGIDDTAIDSASALTAALSSGYKAGDSAKLVVKRQMETLTLTITFDEKNTQTEAANQPAQPEAQQPEANTPNNNYQWPFGQFPW